MTTGDPWTLTFGDTCGTLGDDPEISNVIPGDVDGDGEVTNLDGTYLLRYLADWKYDNLQLEAMDVDADGEITNLDGTFLLRYLAGWDIELK